MLSINYPEIKSRDDFETDFYNSVKLSANEDSINKVLRKISVGGVPLTFRDVVLAPFERLLVIQESMSVYFEHRQRLFAFIDARISYEKARDDIKGFFTTAYTNKRMDIVSCHYCNIDFINVFNDFGGYANKVQFLNQASKRELMAVPGVGGEAANEIIRERTTRKIKNLDLNFLITRHKNSIKKFDFEVLKATKCHFTLDHVLGQGPYPFLAVSLYNLVPSCYPCNTKFKHKKKFELGKNLIYLSPTSNSFAVDQFPIFGIQFKNGKDKSNVRKLEDFTITYDDYIFGQEEFLEIFKIKGRYHYHQREALNLMLKSQKYSDSYIKEMAKLLPLRDEISIKVDIFGDDLFGNAQINRPFAKFRRDIAKIIGLI